MSAKTLVFRLFILLVLPGLFLSCGPKNIGYGVVVWSPEEQLVPTGSLVPVYEDSSIRDVYVIGTEGDSESLYEMPRSRVAFFNKEKDAESFAADYARYKVLYAITLKDGLAIRSEADELSERVYKLREGQVIKVLEMLEPSTRVGDYEDHWYKVMTEEGISGYCFGHNIEVYDYTERDDEVAVESKDPKLEAFMSRVYRPAYYKDMLDEGRIDLERFTTHFGVFPNPEARRIRIVLPENTYTVEYESIKKTGGDRYDFTGSSLNLITNTMNKVVLSFSGNNKDAGGTYHYIDGIEDLRTAEQERRETLKLRFSELGTLRSAAYGTISFTEDGTFTWEGYERLIPSIIPGDAGVSGILGFNRFLSSGLKADYDGALTLRFDTPAETELCFLYSFREGGLRLVYVPDEDIDQAVISRENPSPIVLFFSP